MNLYEMLEYVMNVGMATIDESSNFYIALSPNEEVVAYNKNSHKKLYAFIPSKTDATYNWIPYQPKPVLSDDEKVILRNIDSMYEWIARDNDGKLYCFDEKPYKVNRVWDCDNDSVFLGVFNHLFRFIKWVDTEPTLIEDLLK